MRERLFFTVTCIFLLFPVVAWPAAIQVPVTGQASCFGPAGESIPCTATGQDGELRKGSAWPAPRFTDNGNGTITDNLTGLLWLKDAGCLTARSWSVALASIQTLSSGQCGLSDGSAAGEWRLPNVIELESLISLSAVSPALPTGWAFSNLDPSAYWTSTTHAHYTANAWTINLNDGSVGGDVKTLSYRVLPVRGGL